MTSQCGYSSLMLLISLLLVSISTALPSHASKHFHVHRALANDFADPALIQVNKTWWAFSTNNRNSINVQVARSEDFNSWRLTGIDALPSVGEWVDRAAPAVWAPHVIQNDAGRYILYYSARPKGSSRHCVGAAQSDTIQGPYRPFPKAFACPLSQGGAIDSSGFQDTTGDRYVLYKVDGNAIGNGGNCGNGIEPLRPTPIIMQPVERNGITPRGSPVQILDRSQFDGPLVEAPSLMRGADGKYILFFSSNCFDGPWYDVSYAVSDRLFGPYVKAHVPFAVTGTGGLYSPGGLTVAADGEHVVFHASNGKGGRGMYAARVKLDDKASIQTI